MWEQSLPGGSAQPGIYCYDLDWGGFSDWKVPTVDELRTLIRGCNPNVTGGKCDLHYMGDGAPARLKDCVTCTEQKGPANGCYWPSELQRECITGYKDGTWVWTRSNVPGDQGGPTNYQIHFDDASITGCAAGVLRAVMCVRNDSSCEIDGLPYNETWTDSETGLMWEAFDQCSSRPYCDGFEWAGYDDWRLPTISELRSLVQGCQATETGGSCGITDECTSYSSCWEEECEGCTQNEGSAPGGFYWPAALGACSKSSSIITTSSTWRENSAGYYWGVGFPTGGVDSIGYDGEVGLSLCVRDVN